VGKQRQKIRLGAAAPMIKSKVKCGILLLLVQLPPSQLPSSLFTSLMDWEPADER
jgi:hypothetical protein